MPRQALSALAKQLEPNFALDSMSPGDGGERDPAPPVRPRLAHGYSAFSSASSVAGASSPPASSTGASAAASSAGASSAGASSAAASSAGASSAAASAGVSSETSSA